MSPNPVDGQLKQLKNGLLIGKRIFNTLPDGSLISTSYLQSPGINPELPGDNRVIDYHEML